MYDTVGNILQKDGLTFTYGQNAGPHAVTSLSDGTQMTYDANGNMTSKHGPDVKLDYAFDEENRLKEVYKSGDKIAEYSYDGDGGRVQKTVYTPNGGFIPGLSFGQAVAPVVTQYIGQLFETHDGIYTEYVYLGWTRVAAVTSAGKTLYYHTDHLGGANVLTDETGVVKEITEYEPYGDFSRRDILGTPDEVAWHYFTGHIYDDETGLIYMQARYYDPTVGRFITPDTIVQNPTDPQTLNRYSYVSNNPINRFDPDGRSWKKFFKAIGNTFKFIHNPVQSNPFVNGIVTGNWSYARDMAIAGATGFLFGGPIGAATAMATTAVMRTPAAQWTTENLAHSVFDNAFGMSPRTAYIFSTITVSVGVSLGAEKMLASASGAKPAQLRNEPLTNEEIKNLQINGQYAGDENVFGPSLKTKGAFERSDVKGLVQDGKLVGSFQKRTLDVPGLKQLGAQHTSVNALNASGLSVNPLSYATWGVCNQAANATLLNAGISSTVLNLGPSWDVFVTTAVYGNYGGQLGSRVISGINANQNYEE